MEETMSKNSRRKRRREQEKAVNPKLRMQTKLELWQKRLADSDAYWDAERQKMDHREALYNGDDELKPLVPGDTKPNGLPKKTSHVRNIIFENIESQISASTPKPKVTPRRKKDEHLADLIEHFLRNELDRQPFETMNDMAERTVPVQGGVGFMVEWDNTKRTHMTIGEADVSTVHPKQFGPQPGIYTGIEDMDWFIVKVPTTKEEIRRKYGVAVYDESESEPDVRGTGNEDTAEDTVTMYVGFEKGEAGGINKYVWVNDVELEDLENYQARRQPVCAKCGRVRPLPGQVIFNNVQKDIRGGYSGEPISREQLEQNIAGHQLALQMATLEMQADSNREFLQGVDMVPDPAPEKKYNGGPCPWCGSEESIYCRRTLADSLRPSAKGVMAMAIIREIIEAVDACKPNAFAEKEKLKWLAELDGKIAADVFLMSIEDVQAMNYCWPEDLETETLVRFPHDDLYRLWLMAKIDFGNGEYEKYQNTMAMYNAAYSNFVRWFASTYDPAQGYRRNDEYEQMEIG